MKTCFTALLLLVIVHCIHAQKIEKFFNYKWEQTDVSKARFYTLIEKQDSFWHRRDYFIIERKLQMDGSYRDSSCKIPEGKFMYFYPNGRLQSTETYHNGKLTGVRLAFHSNGMMSDSTVYENDEPVGTSLGWHSNGFIADSIVYTKNGSVNIRWFDNGAPCAAGRRNELGIRTGVWQFFHRNGQLSAKILFDNGKMKSEQYFDESGTPVQDQIPDMEAMFPGGLGAWKKFIEKQLYFPKDYTLVNTDEAVVVIEAIIDEEGNVTDVEVTTPFHPEFDRIAVNAIKRSPKWQPAVENNRRVKYILKQTVFFKQSSD